MKLKVNFTSVVLIIGFSLAVSMSLGEPLLTIIAVMAILGQLMPKGFGFGVVVSNPLIGHSRKSMGNATFSTWKGLDVLKTKPTSVANPQTDKQKMRRSALRQVVEIFRLFPGLIREGFKKGASHMSEYNRFAKAALKNSFDYSAPPVATLMPINLLLSKGTIETTAIVSTSDSIGAGIFTINFPNTISGPGQSLTDQTIAVVRNTTKDTWAFAPASVNRSTGTVNVPIPDSTAVGDALRFYLGFFNEISGESADSSNAPGVAGA